MVKVLILLALSGCAQMQMRGLVVIEPVDAIRLCSGSIKSYQAITGNIECK